MNKQEVFIERVREAFEEWMISENARETSEMTMILQYKEGKGIVRFY